MATTSLPEPGAAVALDIDQTVYRRISKVRLVTGRVLRRPAGLAAVAMLGLIIVLTAAAPIVAPHNPAQQHPGDELLRPFSRYLLGTDFLGRDMLSRVLYGGRISLLVAAAAGFAGTLVGGGTGLLVGYFGRAFDAVVMRVWDVVFAVPPILIGIAVTALLGPSAVNAAIAASVATMPIVARVVRSTVLAEMGKEYVEAARSSGARHGRIMVAHLLPNVLGPLFVMLALSMSSAIQLEAALSFLGIGVQPPQASWGTLLAESRQYISDAPWYAVPAGLCLTVVVLSFNFLADALRDAFDPRFRR